MMDLVDVSSMASQSASRWQVGGSWLLDNLVMITESTTSLLRVSLVATEFERSVSDG